MKGPVISRDLKYIDETTLVDLHVSKQLKSKRIALRLTQNDLAKVANVTIQQIQKYENGRNRITCGRLYIFAKLFSVPIEFFFKKYINSEIADDRVST